MQLQAKETNYTTRIISIYHLKQLELLAVTILSIYHLNQHVTISSLDQIACMEIGFEHFISKAQHCKQTVCCLCAIMEIEFEQFISNVFSKDSHLFL